MRVFLRLVMLFLVPAQLTLNTSAAAERREESQYTFVTHDFWGKEVRREAFAVAKQGGEERGSYAVSVRGGLHADYLITSESTSVAVRFVGERFHFRSIKLPLNEGDVWHWEVVESPGVRPPQRFALRCTAGRMETVTVPVGRFVARRYECINVAGHTTAPMTHTRIGWLAPDLNLDVRVQHHWRHFATQLVEVTTLERVSE